MNYLTIVTKNGKELFRRTATEDGFMRFWYPQADGFIKHPETEKMYNCRLIAMAHDPKENRIIATWEVIKEN